MPRTRGKSADKSCTTPERRPSLQLPRITYQTRAEGGSLPDAPAGDSSPAYPAVPTLLATRLQLELLLSEPVIDLAAAAGVILNDLGATLEIFRRAAEEGVDSLRLEDCLVSLGADAWMEAVCGNAVERVAAEQGQLPELTAFWEHGRLLAYACWFVTGHLEGICPEEAYLVGLLHEVTALPGLLGWGDAGPVPTASFAQRVPALKTAWTARPLATANSPAREASAHLDGLSLQWGLPQTMWQMLASAGASTQWAAVLDMAHAWSRGEECALGYIA